MDPIPSGTQPSVTQLIGSAETVIQNQVAGLADNGKAAQAIPHDTIKQPQQDQKHAAGLQHSFKAIEKKLQETVGHEAHQGGKAFKRLDKSEETPSQGDPKPPEGDPKPDETVLQGTPKPAG